MKFALIGNPNSGKTTLFNALTGSNQYVGNWPGVTVEKKEGRLKSEREITLVDLPGIYSLSPYTPEEIVTRNFLLEESPEVIINIVDGTNIERNLYLTTQILEIGIPTIVCLNMGDIMAKNGDQVDLKKISERLGCPVVEVSALKNTGIKEIIRQAKKLAALHSKPVYKVKFSDHLEKCLQELQSLLPTNYKNSTTARWYSIKLFEHDERVLDRIGADAELRQKIEQIAAGGLTDDDDDPESVMANERYLAVENILLDSFSRLNSQKPSVSERIDKILTNRFWALPIFVAIMFLIYYVSISGLGGWLSGLLNDSVFGPNGLPGILTESLVQINTAPWLVGLLVDGVLAGVGAVLGFLPQMILLFFFLAVLEDCGYMSRIAFILDKIFRKFGLTGKSFIPMLVATGCGIPGIMASRTIENERDRKLTVMTVTFMPCSAKLPIIAMIAGALFGQVSWFIAPSAYLLGIFSVVISGVILKKFQRFKSQPSPFVMELPAYHLPDIRSLLRHVWDRLKSFLKKAGTIILLASVLVWFLQSFSWTMQMVSEEKSMLADIGRAVSNVFVPLGWGNWKLTVATFTGLVSKENIVGTLGVLYGGSGSELWNQLSQNITPLAGYSFLIFNLLCAPCFGAVGAIHKEMGSLRWTGIAVGFETLFAYALSLIIYRFGLMFSGCFDIFSVIAILTLALLLFMVVRPDIIFRKKAKSL